MMNSISTLPTTFDRASMLERVDGDDTILGIVLEVFLDDSPRALQAIEDAYAAADAAKLSAAAHALKGAAANISAETLRGAAHDLEVIGRESRLAEIPDAVQRVRDALAALRPVLERAMAGEP